MDEAEIILGHDQKSDVTVETHEIDARFAFTHLIHETFVVCIDFEDHVVSRNEGCDDSLGGLLGKGSPFDVEARVLQD